MPMLSKTVSKRVLRPKLNLDVPPLSNNFGKLDWQFLLHSLI